MSFPFNLLDLPMHGVDDGQSAEKENQNPQEYESVDGDDVIVDEAGPRADCAEPHEYREIQKHVDGRL